jgi:hypothetical protein
MDFSYGARKCSAWFQPERPLRLQREVNIRIVVLIAGRAVVVSVGGWTTGQARKAPTEAPAAA